ncbi:hypothetical protein [Ulvibacterium marinum]|nr:hypothetical protein [Ulvibacterium marinum]
MKNKQYVYILILLASIFFNLTGCALKKQNPESPSVAYDSILSPKLLNSERIKMKYGSYAIKIFSDDSKTRISNLYSSQDDKKITRTFALVNYSEVIDSTFLEEHREIVKGGSIGRVFKNNGWEIGKESVFFGELSPSKDLSKVYTLMGNIAYSELAIYMYGFYIEKNKKRFQYATIVEIYHPDYLTIHDLKSMNKDANKYLEKSPFIDQTIKEIAQITRKLKP